MTPSRHWFHFTALLVLLFAIEVAGALPAGAEWIWADGVNATNSVVHFRRVFAIEREVKSAELRAVADDAMAVWLNGEAVGQVTGFQRSGRFDVTSPGANCSPVRAGLRLAGARRSAVARLHFHIPDVREAQPVPGFAVRLPFAAPLDAGEDLGIGSVRIELHPVHAEVLGLVLSQPDEEASRWMASARISAWLNDSDCMSNSGFTGASGPAAPS